MRSLLSVSSAAISAILLTGCAASATIPQAENGQIYKYGGEKYAVVNVQLSSDLAAVADNQELFDDLALDKAIRNYLIKSGLFDRSSGNSIAVVIDNLSFRGISDAKTGEEKLWTDRLSGLVTLKDKDGSVLANFSVKEENTVGGGAGGSPIDNRLGWLAGKLGELIASTILNPERDTQSQPKLASSPDSIP